MTEVHAEDVKEMYERAYGEPAIVAHAMDGEEWVAVTLAGDPTTLIVASDLEELMHETLRRWHRESGVGAALDDLMERGCQFRYRVDGEYIRVAVEKGDFEEEVGSATPRGLSARLELVGRYLDSHENRDYGPELPRSPYR